MADDHEELEPTVEPELPRRARRTAPQSDYRIGDVATGLAVLVVGLVLTFGIAFAL